MTVFLGLPPMRTLLTTTTALLGAVLVTGCGGSTPQADAPVALEAVVEETAPSAPTSAPAEATSNTPAAPAPSPANSANYFQEGVNLAQSAVSIGQSAQSPQDWELAASRWRQAINYMQQVPQADQQYSTAQQKVEEYQQNLAQAQQRAAGTIAAVQTQTAEADAPPGRVARIGIIDRRGGTPIVPVKLTAAGGTQQFPMLFDTGATGTLITPAMANQIGVTYVEEVIVTVADGRQVRMPIGFVDIEVGGLVKRNVPVVVGGDVGLLGQDVYGEFGISAGTNVIDLYR
jgi:predicted aspartyl protease